MATDYKEIGYRRLAAAILKQSAIDLAGDDWIMALDALAFFETNEARFYLEILGLFDKNFIDVASSWRDAGGKFDFRDRGNFIENARRRDRGHG